MEKVPAGWQLELLGNLVMKMSNGANVKQHDESVGYPISRIETIWNGNIDSQRVKYIKENDSDFVNKYKLKEGDILFSHINSDSHIGKTAIYRGQPEVLIHGINLLLIRFSDEYCQDFFNYQFKYLKEKGAFSAVAQRAVNQSSINQHKLKSFPFIYPNLEEQKRIVVKIEELFSELDSGIASLKTAQEQLKIYRQALLKHAFEGKLTAQWRKDNADKLETPEQLLARIQTEREIRYQQQFEEWKQAVKEWEAKGKEGKKPGKPAAHKPHSTVSVEEVDVFPTLPNSWNYIRLAEIAAVNSGMSVSKNRKLADPIEVNYLRVANVQRGYLDLSEIKTMNIEKVDLPRLLLEKNDVLFNEGGDLDKLGRGWIWENQASQCITQNHVFRASPFVNKKYHAKFISYWGNSYGRNYFEDGGKQTTNLASINKTVLSNFPIPLPIFEEQQEIVNLLEEKLSIVEQNEKEIERALAKAELLRQSILKKAFSGQLHLGEKL